MLQIVKQPENGGAGYVLVAVMDGDPGKWMTLVFDKFLGLGMQEILFIALIVLLFFGGKKIPELMKGLGKGVKSFKEGMNGVEDDIDGKDKKGETKE